MNEILTNLLLAVLTAAIPTLGGFLLNLLDKSMKAFIQKVDNETAKRFLNEAADVVHDAVASTFQTYVDAMKKAGTFDEEAQKQALSMALAACWASLSPEALEFIENRFNDVTAYLTNKIEAEVLAQKNGIGTLVAA